MPSLQLRELPEPIYQKLKQEAVRRHRTLAQQAIVTLAEGLNISLNFESRREKTINAIKINADTLSNYRLSNPVELIREDRE